MREHEGGGWKEMTGILYKTSLPMFSDCSPKLNHTCMGKNNWIFSFNQCIDLIDFKQISLKWLIKRTPLEAD